MATAVTSLTPEQSKAMADALTKSLVAQIVAANPGAKVVTPDPISIEPWPAPKPAVNKATGDVALVVADPQSGRPVGATVIGNIYKASGVTGFSPYWLLIPAALGVIYLVRR